MSDEYEIKRDTLISLLQQTATAAGGRHALLFGPRGTGKTTSACASARDGQEVFSITLTDEQSAASLWGHYVPKGDKFIWQDGPVLRAWRSGGLLVINELDHASEDVSNLLHVALDNPTVAQVTLPTGETVTPGQGFRCIATMNGGIDDLAPAVLDRFSLSTAVAVPSVEMLGQLPDDLRELAVEVYDIADGDEPLFTYREFLAISQLRNVTSLGNAAALVLGYDQDKVTNFLYRSYWIHKPELADIDVPEWIDAWLDGKREKVFEEKRSRDETVVEQHAVDIWDAPGVAHQWRMSGDGGRDGVQRRLSDALWANTRLAGLKLDALEAEAQIQRDFLATDPRSTKLVRDHVADVLAKSATPDGGSHVLLFGARGTGKTTMAARSARAGQEVFSVTLTDEQSAASLWGHFVPRGDRFVWQDGPVLRAWRSGGLLVINEIDHASEDVSNLMHAALDNPAVAQVTLPTGETVRPARGFRCIATMNGVADDLAPAVLDRFAIATPVNEPSTEMLAVLPDDVRSVAAGAYAHLDGVDPAVTFREMLAFAQFRSFMSEERAAVAVLGFDRKAAHWLVTSVRAARGEMSQRLVPPVSMDQVNREAEHRIVELNERKEKSLHELARRMRRTGYEIAEAMAMEGCPSDEEPQLAEIWNRGRALEQKYQRLYEAVENRRAAQSKRLVAKKQIAARSIPRDELSLLLKATAAPRGGNHILLYGPRGTGKTTAAVRSKRRGQMVFSETLTNQMSAAALWGHYVPQGKKFVWQDGPLLKAWRTGSLLVLNEIDHASEDVSNLLHVLLDNPEVASVTLPTGETIQPAKGFRCIATMNGDVGELATAVLDRFSVVQPVLEPSTQMIAALPSDLRPLATWLYSSENTRKEENGEPQLTYRNLADFAWLRKTQSIQVAALLACEHDRAKAISLVEASQQQRARRIGGAVRPAHGLA